VVQCGSSCGVVRWLGVAGSTLLGRALMPHVDSALLFYETKQNQAENGGTVVD
jgi:hypothetical protein